MTDYSQHGEQAHILDFFKNYKGRFLDLGAFDGVSGSNTRALAERGWEGVSVEANPFVFPHLCNNALAGTLCVNAAIMEREGIIQFWCGKDQCGTALATSPMAELNPRKHFIAAVSPDLIAERFGANFDFISLDIEGSDLEVLAAMDVLCEKASLLCIEDAIPFYPYNQEYYDKLVAAAIMSGFTRTLVRLPNDGTGNTLLVNDENYAKLQIL